MIWLDLKKNAYMYLFYGLLIIFILYLMRPETQPPMSGSKETFITGGSLDVHASGFNSSSYPGQRDVKTDVNGGGVYLGGNRFAIINNNENSSTYGTILIYEYDEKAHKLNYLTTDNFVVRMNTRTE